MSQPETGAVFRWEWHDVPVPLVAIRRWERVNPRDGSTALSPGAMGGIEPVTPPAVLEEIPPSHGNRLSTAGIRHLYRHGQTNPFRPMRSGVTGTILLGCLRVGHPDL